MDQSILLIIFLGAFVGLLMGLTGAGGGILSVPLLVFFLHLPMAQASPIALCAIAFSASIGAVIGLNNHTLRYKAAIFMSIFGLILSPVGLWIAKIIPNNPLIILFSAILFYTSIRLFHQASQSINGTVPKEKTPPPCKLDLSIGKLIWTVPCARSLMYAGAGAGFLSGLLGVGGGFIIVPALKKFTDLPMKSIVATSLGVLAIVSSGGAIVSLASGHLNIAIALPFSLGSMLGLLMGKGLEKKISGARLQQLFAIFTFIVAISLIVKTI
jgi:uncharacterized membrane protein YfcA